MSPPLPPLPPAGWFTPAERARRANARLAQNVSDVPIADRFRSGLTDLGRTVSGLARGYASMTLRTPRFVEDVGLGAGKLLNRAVTGRWEDATPDPEAAPQRVLDWLDRLGQRVGEGVDPAVALAGGVVGPGIISKAKEGVAALGAEDAAMLRPRPTGVAALAPEDQALINDPMTDLVHYSRVPGLTELDPARMGSAGGGGVKSYTNPATPNLGFAYDAGTRPEPFTVGMIPYRAQVPASKIADISQLPDIRAIAEQGGDWFTPLRQQGFLGYRNSEGPMPHAVALFEKTPLRAPGSEFRTDITPEPAAERAANVAQAARLNAPDLPPILWDRTTGPTAAEQRLIDPFAILARRTWRSVQDNTPMGRAVLDDVKGMWTNTVPNMDRVALHDPTSLLEFHNAFSPVRDALKQRFGDTIRLWRAVDPSEDTSQRLFSRWADRPFAERFLEDTNRHLVSRDVPVDDITGGVFSGRAYREYIVREPTARALYGPPETSSAEAAAAHASANPSGFTLDPRTGQPFAGSGYLVGQGRAGAQALHVPVPAGATPAVTAAHIQSVLEQNPTHFANPEMMLGGWHDVAKHRFTLEPSRVMTDRAAALQEGGRLGEQAVGHIENGKYIGDLVPRPQSERPIRVYHGSAHAFDDPDFSKIGTGQGAATFGHGFYVAENPAVAEDYQRGLGGWHLEYNGAPVEIPSLPELRTPDQRALAMLHHEIVSNVDATGSLEAGVHTLKDVGPIEPEFEPDRLRALELVQSGAVRVRPGGHLYTFDMNAHPDTFLDWDQPLNKQSPFVQQELRHAFGFDQHVPPGRPLRGASWHATGGNTYESLSRPPYQEATIPRWGTPAEVSQRLNAMGVNGIRYLDQGSRLEYLNNYLDDASLANATRNHVLFDPQTITTRLRDNMLADERTALANPRARVVGSDYERARALLPSPDQLASAALAGNVRRNWYTNSTQSMVDTFGPDAPRFAALLAALSPQQSVENNLDMASDLWLAWNRAGRPSDPKRLARLVPRFADIRARTINAISALSSDDPAQLALNGPKVFAFHKNLIGDADRVTLDTWMAHLADIDPANFGATSRNTSGTYIAYSQKVRDAARILTTRTGHPWTPAEVQAAAWSWAKPVGEAGGINHVVEDQVLHAVPDFASQFQEREAPARMAVKLGLPEPRATAPASSLGAPTAADEPHLRALQGNIAHSLQGKYLFGAAGLLGAGAAAAKALPPLPPDVRRRRN